MMLILKVLQIQNDTLTKRLKEFEGQSETNTYLQDGLSKKPLPNNAQIEFRTGANKMNKVCVCIRNDGLVDVNTDSRLGERMVVMPCASNSFYITFVKD